LGHEQIINRMMNKWAVARARWVAVRHQQIMAALDEGDLDGAQQLADELDDALRELPILAADLVQRPMNPSLDVPVVEARINEAYERRWHDARLHRELAESALRADRLDEARVEVAAAVRLVPYDKPVNDLKNLIDEAWFDRQAVHEAERKRRRRVDEAVTEARVRLRRGLLVNAQSYLDDAIALDPADESANQLIIELRQRRIWRTKRLIEQGRRQLRATALRGEGAASGVRMYSGFCPGIAEGSVPRCGLMPHAVAPEHLHA
jgi:hypothetical protein